MSNPGYFALGLCLLVVYLVAMAAVLFGAAGTFAVPMFWAYLFLFAILCVGASAAVHLLSPDLVKERVRPGEGAQDRVTVRARGVAMTTCGMLVNRSIPCAVRLQSDWCKPGACSARSRRARTGRSRGRVR